MLVHATDADELLKTLHDTLIGKGLDRRCKAEVFGPSWQELQG